jgi:hypothetical protein
MLPHSTVFCRPVHYEPGGDAVGKTKVCQHGYTACIKPDLKRDPDQEVLVPDLVILRSSLIVLTEQYDVSPKARQFAVE